MSGWEKIHCSCRDQERRMLDFDRLLRMKGFFVKSSSPPTVEIDSCASSVYIRFQKSAKIARTVSEDRPGVFVAVDLDATGGVIGVELVGVKEFGVSVLMSKAQIQAPKVDFSRTRYISTRQSVLQDV